MCAKQLQSMMFQKYTTGITNLFLAPDPRQRRIAFSKEACSAANSALTTIKKHMSGARKNMFEHVYRNASSSERAYSGGLRKYY